MPSSDLGASVRVWGPCSQPSRRFGHHSCSSWAPGAQATDRAALPGSLPGSQRPPTQGYQLLLVCLQISAQPTDPPPGAVSLPLWDCFLPQLPREGLWTSGRDSGG